MKTPPLHAIPARYRRSRPDSRQTVYDDAELQSKSKFIVGRKSGQHIEGSVLIVGLRVMPSRNPMNRQEFITGDARQSPLNLQAISLLLPTKGFPVLSFGASRRIVPVVRRSPLRNALSCQSVTLLRRRGLRVPVGRERRTKMGRARHGEERIVTI